MGVWFTSDTHFQHRLVAGLRGFAPDQVDEYNATTILTWNSYVRPGDLVWHLGDVFLGDEKSGLSLVSQLNGAKHLVTGNHDKVWPGHQDARKHQKSWLEVFESVQAFAKIRIGPKPTVLLSHFPPAGVYDGRRPIERDYPEFRLTPGDRWLIHGHTHSDVKLDGPKSIHVGWDAWHRPVSLEEIRELMGL
jgi:calcineurin-like phosphoesterase family protein